MKAVVEKRRVLLDGFFHVEEAEVSFELFNGAMSPPARRLNLRRDLAVAAILVNRAKGTVVLVKQFRYSALETGKAWMIEVVAGLIDAGESPDAAIRREAVEEAGYEVGALELITTFFTTPGFCSERIALYYAETKTAEPAGAGGGLALETEDIEVVELPYADAFALLDKGEIVDGKTLIALLWLKDRLRTQG